MVTPGAKWAIFATLAALLEPGDDVLMLDPSWVSYAPMVLLHRANPVRWRCPALMAFRVTVDLLERHITPQHKGC
jgi:aspartate/methionine/tyrosine aminotransferase